MSYREVEKIRRGTKGVMEDQLKEEERRRGRDKRERRDRGEEGNGRSRS